MMAAILLFLALNSSATIAGAQQTGCDMYCFNQCAPLTPPQTESACAQQCGCKFTEATTFLPTLTCTEKCEAFCEFEQCTEHCKTSFCTEGVDWWSILFCVAFLAVGVCVWCQVNKKLGSKPVRKYKLAESDNRYHSL